MKFGEKNFGTKNSPGRKTSAPAATGISGGERWVEGDAAGPARQAPHQTTPRHATPPPPARSVPWRHPPPARRARALYRGNPRGLQRTRPATRTATVRSPRSPRLLVARSRSPRHARATATACLLHVSRQGSRGSVPGGRAIRAPRRCREVFSGYSNDRSVLSFELQLPVWPAKQFGFKVFARPESRPNPIAG